METRTKAIAEIKKGEIERTNKLVAALRDISEAKDAILLDQAVSLGRKLAKEPGEVNYRIDMFSPVRLGRDRPRVPVLDKTEERFRVERQYYGNPHVEIPEPPSPFFHTNSFPHDIPKEWYPDLVNAIIGTLPDRYPSYYSIANGDRYGERSPVALIRQLARLADEVEQRYLWTSQGAIAEFIAHTFADHWSTLSGTIRSVLIDRESTFLSLGSDLLNFAAFGTIKSYRPHLVRLAIIQGVSESICYMNKRINAEQKAGLASTYASLLMKGHLNGLGPRRLFHDKLYCETISWEFEDDENDGVIEVARLAPAEDHIKGHISVDRALTSAVLAMGIVSPDSPLDPQGGTGHFTMRIVQHLPRVFDSYREPPALKRLLKDSEHAASWDSKLDHACVDDFVEGIYKISQKRHHRSEVDELIASASVLVPDIAVKLDRISGDATPE